MDPLCQQKNEGSQKEERRKMEEVMEEEEDLGVGDCYRA